MKHLNNMTMNELDFLRKVWGGNTEASPFPSKISADNKADANKQNFSNTDNTRNTDNAQIIKKLKDLDFFQKRVNILKVVVIFLLLTFFVTSICLLSNITVDIYIGGSIIIASIVVFILYYLKNQVNSSKLDYTLNSVQFAKEAISALKKQNRVFGLPFILFILALISGVNIIYLRVEPDTTTPVIFHIGLSLIIALSGLLGLLVRRWRIRKEVTPLIEELNKLEGGYFDAV
jgi:hypothetical protein